MTNKDYYMMGIKNCMAVLSKSLVHGIAELISVFMLPPDRFDKIASDKFDEHEAAYVAAYKKGLENAKNRPTQPEGNA